MPSSDGLGGEEGVKDPLQGLGRHALPRVPHRDQRIDPRIEARRHPFRAALHHDGLGLHPQVTPSRHGIAGVHREVDDRLFKLNPIHPHRSDRRVEGELELDVLADDASEQRGDTLDRRVQVDDLGLQHLTTAERQQLPGEVSGAPPSLPDLAQKLSGRGVSDQLEGELGATVDDGQEVVEVMGDAPGQLAHGLKLLGLSELRLQALHLQLGALSLRDVSHQADVPAPGLLERDRADLDGKGRPVLAAMDGLEGDSLSLKQPLPETSERRLVGPDIDLSRASADQLVARVTKARAGLRVHIKDREAFIEQIERVRGVLDDGAELRLAVATGLLRLSQVGDVEHHAEHAQRAPLCVTRDLGAAVDDPLRAAGLHHPILDVVARLTAQRRAQDVGDALTVVGVQQRQPAGVPLMEVDRAGLGGEAEDAARLVRERHLAGREVAVPVSDVRHALRVFEAPLALAKHAHDRGHADLAGRITARRPRRIGRQRIRQPHAVRRRERAKGLQRDIERGHGLILAEP